MKPRVAWIADAEDADSYSAREARILLRALARRPDILPLWFAAGSQEPPHFWNGVRVFPLPGKPADMLEFLPTLVNQQRPDVVVCALPVAGLATATPPLSGTAPPWINRTDARRELPLLGGLDPAVSGSLDLTGALVSLKTLIARTAKPAPAKTPAGMPHLIMRQQLFCNASLSHVMFELTNALLELGVPAVAQDDSLAFSKGFIHREEDIFRSGAPDKHRRVAESVNCTYDPDEAITVHFSMFQRGMKYCRFGAFPSLGPREVLYATGNHTAAPESVRLLGEAFEMILAPSWHVLRPYLDAGLPRNRGAVIPHGVDPAVFCPQQPPHAYGTRKSFKFLQTSFPWITEKGFDLTVKAFGRAFSSGDDVALILRVPRIRDPRQRTDTFGRLESLVRDERARPHAPEILLVEADVPLAHRGGFYTGADCYVHPLRAEGFGMTILEAMACGLPVIATPWSGPADFLSPRLAYTLRHSGPIPERANGVISRYHVEPDLEHLIHLMRHVFECRDEAKAVGRAAAETARGHWTWKHAAEKLASIFHLPF